MSTGQIYMGGGNVWWEGAKDDATNTWLDGNAACVFSVYETHADYPADESNGDVVTGGSAVSMSYVASSNGNFVGNLPPTASLTRGSWYWLEVTCTPSGGVAHTRRQAVQAVDRGFGP